MGRFAALVLPVVLLFAAAQPAFADHIDGMSLRLTHGAAPGDVTLDWTGGQPLFSVYRSTSKTLIVDRSNLIGMTDVRNFADTPPAGAVFFYEIASPCVYNPPEVCNGLDDDCDGAVDGPGSEASCSLPNAAPACVAGACAVVACNDGYGDCDAAAANGCEASLGVMQSTSPSSLWAGDPNPDKDLAPGFLRVATIKNCGGCGVTCDDGISCTTDLCVPAQQAGGMVGTCRHYKRSQCSEARCGSGPLPPGTPIPGDAACTGPDSDGDGLPDPWETPQPNPYDASIAPIGIDLDCDGQISASDNDFIYSDPPAGPAVKDVYLKLASMAQGPSDSGSHAPRPGVVEAVVAAFSRQGIDMHVDPLIADVPHFGTVSFGGTATECTGADSTTVANLKTPVFDPKEKYVKRFFVFGHDSCANAGNGNSGVAEILGNDGIVSLGTFTYTGTPTEVTEQRIRAEAGTLMHELGHNLGLDHGETDSPCTPAPCDSSRAQKPNHISSMNFSYQLNGIPRAATPGTLSPPDPEVPWRVDFSPAALGTLDEAHLNEIDGLAGAAPPYDRDVARYYCLGQGPLFAPGQGPIDWNCDHVFSPSAISDIDNDGTLVSLPGAQEWGHLDFRFQCTPAFADGPTDPALVTPGELTLAVAVARGLLPGPPPCLTSADCDDGVFCNGAETCQPATGVCQPGAPPSCDDGNSCTSDACSTATNSCLHTFAPTGMPCDDGAWCTVGEACTNGVCRGGAPRDCDDGLPCTANACIESQQACVVTACTTAPCFSTPVGPGSPAGDPKSDRSIVPAGVPSSTFFVKGSALYALRDAADPTGPAGSVKWTWNSPTGQTLNNFPAPVALSNGAGEYLYVGSTDGFVYKVRASDGAQTAQADTRRSSCPLDQIVATPAVQLYRFSNAAWQGEMDSHPGHGQDDVVFVITRNQCGDATHNRVFAYYASDLSPKAIFNNLGNFQVDYGSEGCAVDYANNRLYCGTNLNPLLQTPSTLWAFDSTTVQVIWSGNAGSVLNRPMLKGGRIYVAARDGSIMAYDPAGSPTGNLQRLWTTPAVVPAPVLRNPWVEFRPPAGLNTIFVVDGAGRLHRFTDQGAQATIDWVLPAGPGLQFVTMPIFAPGIERVYLGRNDGFLQQVNATTGAAMTAVPFAPPGIVSDPGLDLPAGSPYGWLTVASGGTVGGVTGFCAPLP